MTSLLPDWRTHDIRRIDRDFLTKNNIDTLLIDLDNTLIGHNSASVATEINNWISSAKQNGIKFCIVTNGHRKRAERISKDLDIPFITCNLWQGRGKPNPIGFIEAINLLNANKPTTVVVGDQLMTDVQGASRAGLRSILVEPLNPTTESIFTRIINRPREKRIRNHKLFAQITEI